MAKKKTTKPPTPKKEASLETRGMITAEKAIAQRYPRNAGNFSWNPTTVFDGVSYKFRKKYEKLCQFKHLRNN